jgi:C4-dicarboxylate transporter DctM subunit
MEILIATIAILILIFLGVGLPVCFLTGSLIYAGMTGMSTGSFVSTAYNALDSFGTLAIPLFLAAGLLIEKSGIARTLVDLAEMLMRKSKGGMAASIAVVSCFFGTLSGSGTATVTTISTILGTRLVELGWNKRYVAAFVAAAGPMGYMIPPNMNAIIFARSTGSSISALFLATVVPAIIWTGGYLLVNRLIYAKWYDPNNATEEARNEVKRVEKMDKVMERSYKWQVLKSAIPAILMPVIILGGIYGGIFTPTEAGAAVCVYGVFIGLLFYRRMTVKDTFKAMVDSGYTVGIILIMFPMTLIFTRLLVVNGVPEMIMALITGVSANKIVILLIVDLVLFIAGMFLDTSVLLLVFPPLLLPTMKLIGVSDIQLGVIMFTAIGIGSLTPPMAMNLFIAGRVLNVTIPEMMRPLVPFLFFVSVPVLLLVTFVPGLSLWLPSLIG